MPIPSFDMRGLLPPFVGVDATTQDRSPYLTNMSELATALGTTPHRRHLLRNLIAYRSMLAQAGYTSGVQFIDGSFVENVEVIASRGPGDIDVFSIINMQTAYQGDIQAWGPAEFPFWRDEVANTALNKQRFSLDTYALLFEDLRPLSLIQNTIYWYGLFSHQRSTFAWKGFAALLLDPAGDQAALAALGGP